MKARLIYNPTAGREEIRRHLPDVLEILEDAGLETSCRATKKSGDAVEAARQAASSGYDVVIAAGGDGTVYEVVNGLAGLPGDRSWASFQQVRRTTSPAPAASPAKYTKRVE